MMCNGERGEWRIREFVPGDRDTVLGLAERLAAGIAPWRSVDGMVHAARGWTEASLAGIGSERAVFVAETAGGEIVGFASAMKQIEFTGEAQAYIGELAVGESAEGGGIGSALLGAVEAWAREHGLGLIVLDTGAANTRARRFYGRFGFVEESVRLTRVLENDPAP